MASYRVGTIAELHDAGRLIADVDGRSVGVIVAGDEIFAIRNRCPHQGGPVCEGLVAPTTKAEIDARGRLREWLDDEQPVICCPWHGVEFDLRTGMCLADPAQRVATYDVTVEEGNVIVHL